MVKRIIGFSLLFLGVIIILWGLWSSFQIFTAKKPAPEIFKSEAAGGQNGKVSLPKISGLPAGLENQLGSILQGQLANILPVSSISLILNLTAWSIFMAILVLAGGKISTIGVQLLKETKN